MSGRHDYALKRLSDGERVSFGSSGHPHIFSRSGEGEGFVVATPEASMTVPVCVVDVMTAAERARLREKVEALQNRPAEGAELWSAKFKAGYGVGWERAVEHVLALLDPNPTASASLPSSPPSPS